MLSVILNFEGVLRSPGCFFSHLGGVLGFLRGFVEVRCWQGVFFCTGEEFL
jgi:hypothetical protein